MPLKTSCANEHLSIIFFSRGIFPTDQFTNDELKFLKHSCRHDKWCNSIIYEYFTEDDTFLVMKVVLGLHVYLINISNSSTAKVSYMTYI